MPRAPTSLAVVGAGAGELRLTETLLSKGKESAANLRKGYRTMPRFG